MIPTNANGNPQSFPILEPLANTFIVFPSEVKIVLILEFDGVEIEPPISE